jgi:ABC-type lipoprotein export system ATPase subunit
MTGLAVRAVGLRHVYRLGGQDVVALDGIDLDIEPGATVAVMGPSGSGKSTLMTVIGGLQRPSAGQLFLGEQDLSSLSERALLRIRAQQLGVAVQNPSRNLLPFASAEQNLHFAQRGARSYGRAELAQPAELLDALGMGELAHVRVDRLSGGERQRVALAAAIANSPGVLLADEPTSALDTHNRDRVVALLADIGARFGTTVVIITHDPEVAAAFGRTVRLTQGRLDGSATR